MEWRRSFFVDLIKISGSGEDEEGCGAIKNDEEWGEEAIWLHPHNCWLWLPLLPFPPLIHPLPFPIPSPLLPLLLLGQSNIFSQPKFHGHQESSSSTNSFPRAISSFGSFCCSKVTQEHT
jgi:hypothetical protein